MSLTGSIMILAVMLVRPLLKRWRTHGVLLLLWLAACFMLLVHFRFSSPINVFSAVGNMPVISSALGVGGSFTVAESVSAVADGHIRVMSTSARAVNILHIVSDIWLAGVVITLIYAVVSALLLRKRFRCAVYRADLSCMINNKARVYVSSRAHGPLTYGIIRPRIILPLSANGMDDETLEHVLLHEMQHVRGRHVLINFLWFISLCLHWFNPIVWLGWVYLRRDMEVICDAKVVKSIGAERRGSYAQTLLNMIPVRQAAAFPLAFGSSSAGDRIKEILAYRPATKGAVCVSFFMLLLCIALFAASPAQMVSASTSFSGDIDDMGFYIFRVHTQPIPRGNGNLQQAFYTYTAGFSSLADARLFLVGEYFAEGEDGDFMPECSVNQGFGFSSGNTFSWRGMNVAVETEYETKWYMVMDASTFCSEDLEFEQAVIELMARLWTVSVFSSES